LAARLAQSNVKLSSANSINWGRLLPQIVYYVSAYVDLQAAGKVKSGDKINIVVPTGNFGNILAAFYAGKMGVPINKLICASNTNNVLTEFINTGIYDRKRKFAKTISPSMDILISSNLERLLYEVTGHDHQLVAGWMEGLRTMGEYRVEPAVHEIIAGQFWAAYATDEETLGTISKIWQDRKYLLDTHTAVAFNVYEKYVNMTGDRTVTVLASTASPFKFARSVAQAILGPESADREDEFKLLELLAATTGQNIPQGIRDIDKKPIRHETVVGKEEMAPAVLRFLDLA